MNKATTVLCVTLLIPLLVLPLSRANQSEDKTLVTVQLKWQHKFQFAGFYAAFEQGFYQEEGLNVRLLEGGPGISPVSNVLSAKADYGVESGELLYHRLQGKPLVALASIFQHTPSVLITTESSNLRTPHDLAGKRIAMQVRQQNIFEIAAMFVNEGVALESIQLEENQPFPKSWELLQN